MGLRDAIPGLKAHDTVVASPAPAVAFDKDAAGDVVREAVAAVNASFPSPDAWSWLVDNRPDVVSELKRFGKEMSLACLNQDMAVLTASADLYVRAHARAWQLYADRRPAAESQAVLFEGVR